MCQVSDDAQDTEWSERDIDGLTFAFAMRQTKSVPSSGVSEGCAVPESFAASAVPESFAASAVPDLYAALDVPFNFCRWCRG